MGKIATTILFGGGGQKSGRLAPQVPPENFTQNFFEKFHPKKFGEISKKNFWKNLKKKFLGKISKKKFWKNFKKIFLENVLENSGKNCRKKVVGASWENLFLKHLKFSFKKFKKIFLGGALTGGGLVLGWRGVGDQCWESKKKISGNKFEGGGEVLVES